MAMPKATTASRDIDGASALLIDAQKAAENTGKHSALLVVAERQLVNASTDIIRPV